MKLIRVGHSFQPNAITLDTEEDVAVRKYTMTLLDSTGQSLTKPITKNSFLLIDVRDTLLYYQESIHLAQFTGILENLQTNTITSFEAAFLPEEIFIEYNSLDIRNIIPGEKAYVEFLGEAKNSEDVIWAAQQDILNEKVHLIIWGDLGSVVTLEEAKHAEKFKFTYYEYGCIFSPSEKFRHSYNQEMIRYLDNKYGLVWRKKLRDDIVGFEKRKHEHPQ